MVFTEDGQSMQAKSCTQLDTLKYADLHTATSIYWDSSDSALSEGANGSVPRTRLETYTKFTVSASSASERDNRFSEWRKSFGYTSLLARIICI